MCVSVEELSSKVFSPVSTYTSHLYLNPESSNQLVCILFLLPYSCSFWTLS